MKKGDPASLHRDQMKELHVLFTKKTQYHHQKAYLELKDVYWLVHEFFTAFLGKQKHFTEEEIIAELKSFKHDFLVLTSDVIEGWSAFFSNLSKSQYAGKELTQEELHALVTEFGRLVDDTIGKEYAPADSFSRHIQAARVFVSNGELEKAEDSYKKMMHEYETFDAAKKRQHYEQLERLYESIVALRSGQQEGRPQ